MRIDRVQKRTARKAIRLVCRRRCPAGGVVWAAVTRDGVVHVSSVGVEDAELRVIKGVKRLRAKLQGARFANADGLEDRGIEIGARWIVEGVAPDVAEGQAAGRVEFIGITQQRAETVSNLIGSYRRKGIGSVVGVGAKADVFDCARAIR